MWTSLRVRSSWGLSPKWDSMLFCLSTGTPLVSLNEESRMISLCLWQKGGEDFEMCLEHPRRPTS